MPQLILSLFSTNSLLSARCTIIMRLSLLAFGVSEFHVFHCILPESSIKNITFGFTPATEVVVVSSCKCSGVVGKVPPNDEVVKPHRVSK